MTLGEQTQAIVAAGEYAAPSGRVVSIRDAVARAVLASVDVPPDAHLPPSAPRRYATRIAVVNQTTLAAAHTLGEPLALNFASAKNPGGGWLGGARAQEESLARQSALVATIEGKPMYTFHRSRSDCLYTSWAILSPHVPVFRDEPGALLEEPWQCSFVTCAAPNANVVLERDPSRGAEISAALEERVLRVLGIASQHGFRELVLGAWGCGVFGNDPEDVARFFHAALNGPFVGAFETVLFAVIGGGRAQRNIESFERRFGARAAPDGDAVPKKPRATRISKYLSLVLRHDPSAAGVTLDAEGWVAVDDLLAGAARRGFRFSREELGEVVQANDKQRFAFSADGLRIRASQGHSLSVDLGLRPETPPAVLYHGTVERFVPSIMAAGLEKRARQHVHLSADVATAGRVGSRRGSPIILRVAAAEMYGAGFRFYRSANGVWLTDEVPALYISRMDT